MVDETGTYWSAAEMRKVKVWIRNGHTVEQVAATLRRSVGAVKSRLYYMRVAELASHQDDNATIHTIKKEEKERNEEKRYSAAENHKPNVHGERVRIH